ncbi:MAG: xanthine dehydrogenase family protein subunit M [Anaerolineae bacterium]|nr:xanthine dehydrogenase family protein subunit M [Anaerolineae bacterium]
MEARPGLPSFSYVRASQPAEVFCLLDEHGDAAKLMMGGTDLLVRMRDGVVRPRIVIDVKHLPGMQDVAFDDQNGLTVGAAVTMNRLADHPDVRTRYPLLAQAARSVASYQLRNRATVGGNLCNASPCADIAPAALVLDGQIVLRCIGGERRTRLEGFFCGPGQTSMQPGEYVTAVHFPVPPEGSVGTYLKLGRNRAGDLALVSVAVLGWPDEEASSGFRFSVALGSVAPVPMRAIGAEEVLAARPPGEDAFAEAADEAQAGASPISDVRASAVYRAAMVRNLTLRALRAVWEELRAGDESGG